MFILDASVTMAWCFEDERTPYTNAVLRSFSHESCLVPILWVYEVANILRIGIKRKRINNLEAVKFCDFLSGLPIDIDDTKHNVLDLFNKSEMAELTAYDTQYVALAQKYQLPLATLDNEVKRSMVKLNIPLFLGEKSKE